VFLALREIAFARGRFTLMGSVVALIAILMVLLSGLSVGLVTDGVSGLQRMGTTSFAFQQGIAKDSAFSRSIISRDAVDVWAEQDGVDEAAPFGNALVNGKTDRDVNIDLALFGVDLDSFLVPDAAEGTALTGAPDEVVVSATAAGEGVGVGDVITVE
jgi:putative ABC transport system permease protein